MSAATPPAPRRWGGMHPLIAACAGANAACYYVVNPLQAADLRIRRMPSAHWYPANRSACARCRLTHFMVNNANLAMRQTTAQHLIETHRRYLQAFRQAPLHVPIGMVAGYERLRAELPKGDARRIFFAIEPDNAARMAGGRPTHDSPAPRLYRERMQCSSSERRSRSAVL